MIALLGYYEPIAPSPDEVWRKAEAERLRKRNQRMHDLQREIDRAKRELCEYHRSLGELRALQNEKAREARRKSR